MKYKTTASIYISLHSLEVDVSTVLAPLEFRLEKSHSKGERRIRGDKSPYYENFALFCLREKSVFDIGDELLSICNSLADVETSLKDISIHGGAFWIIVRLHDPEYILFNIGQDVIKILDRLGANLSVENRAS